MAADFQHEAAEKEDLKFAGLVADIFGSLRQVRDLQKRKAKKAALDAQLLEGVRSPTVRMTEKRWEELEQKIKKRSPELD